MHNKILKEILSHRNPEKAKIISGFFKTGKGQYGEGDLFLGITVPMSRKIAIKYSDVTFADLSKLITNKYHEVRLISLLILVHKYKISARSCLAEKKKIVDFYLKNTKNINNWDLVDLSAHYILGDYLYTLTTETPQRKVLWELAKSKNIWERRISIISTFAFIYKRESDWTFKIVEILMNDKHDLIQKACGWMLREVGKRVSENDLIAFLDIHGDKMPRTMLRYAIERFPENKRKYYLNK
jgi:3-methyladenine DNA glycosylase AlkD